MKKQQGVAAIILVLVLIPLFGSVFFALEGTRYIQKKTRLADAAEAAALAVTNQNPEKLTIAENNKESQSLTPLENNNNLASAYINSYVRNIDKDNIIITPELIINKNQNSDAKSYYQYKVNVTTTHNSWFFNELIPSFNPTQDITATALARNYPRLTGDQPIDLVFVADFSGSMDEDLRVLPKEHIEIPYDNNTKSCKAYLKDTLQNNYYYQCDKRYHNETPIYKYIKNKEKKIIALKNSIDIISKEILKNKDNRISFTAFSEFTYEYKYKNYKTVTNLDCDENKIIINKDDDNTYNHSDYNNKYTFYKNAYKDYRIPYCSSTNDNNPCIVNDYLYLNGQYYDNYNNIDKKYIFDKSLYNKNLKVISANLCHFNKMVKNIFTKKPKRFDYSDYYNQNSIYNIELNSNENKIITSIQNMSPQQSTSAYQGIMRGAQLLNKGKYKKKNTKEIKDYEKRKKILILLSDGQESDQYKRGSNYQIEGPYILKHLVVNYKLCEKIRKNFSTDNNKMFMGMIGIGYTASDNDVFHKCFDKNIYNSEHQLISESNIIDVDDLSTLTDKIKELIRKGQQTDGISKLSDGQN